MTAVGIGYLVFEDSVLGRAVPKASLSRKIIGIQVRTAVLSVAPN